MDHILPFSAHGDRGRASPSHLHRAGPICFGEAWYDLKRPGSGRFALCGGPFAACQPGEVGDIGWCSPVCPALSFVRSVAACPPCDALAVLSFGAPCPILQWFIAVSCGDGLASPLSSPPPICIRRCGRSIVVAEWGAGRSRPSSLVWCMNGYLSVSDRRERASAVLLAILFAPGPLRPLLICAR